MNHQTTLQHVVQTQLKDDLPDFTIGDTLDVHVRIIEGEKERIQVFQGVLIARKGSGINATIMVRRIVANEGVERVFPVHSPRVARIEIVRRGDARRAKLYFLRDRVGKKRRLRDQRRGLQRFETHSGAEASGKGTDGAASAESGSEAASSQE